MAPGLGLEGLGEGLHGNGLAGQGGGASRKPVIARLRAVCCGFVREPGPALCPGSLEPAGAVSVSVCQRGCGDGCVGVRETVRMCVMSACV